MLVYPSEILNDVEDISSENVKGEISGGLEKVVGNLDAPADEWGAGQSQLIVAVSPD